MPVQKFKGKNLSLTVGGVEYNDNVTSANIVNEDADDDVQTFADLSAGGNVDYTLEIEAVSDYGTGTLWNYIWSNGGAEAEFVLKPYGNATPTAAQPHFTGTLIVGPPAQIGGTAGETFTYEYTFALTGKPLMDVA